MTKARSRDRYKIVQVRNRHRRRLNLLRIWSWEIALLVAALGLVAAIVVLLANFNGQELPRWPYSININTLASLLTLCLRAALVIVAAEIVGQSKWIWFHGNTQRLSDFQTFDEAAAAAVTTILSLAISPFTQQAIKTVSCARLTSKASARVPVAINVPGVDNFYAIEDSPDMYDLGPRVQRAMVSGLTNPSGNDSAIQAQCLTGNCTFPEAFEVPHSTIGLCSQCMETTSLLSFSWRIEDFAMVKNYNTTNASLGDLTLSLKFSDTWLTTGSTNLSYAESRMSPEFKEVAQQAFSNISILTVSGTTSEFCRVNQLPQCVVAASCTLYPCMKDVRVNVVNGRLEDRVVKTVPARAAPEVGIKRSSWSIYRPDYHVVKSPCVVDGQLRDFAKARVEGEVMSVPSDCRYTMGGDYHHALGLFMRRNLFHGGCKNGLRNDLKEHLDCKHTWWFHQFYNNGRASFESLSTSFQNMATATTNFFREDGWGPIHNFTAYHEGNDSTKFKTFLSGEMWETTVCMRLEWPWLLLPVILCLTTVVLLVAMLLVNAADPDQPVWKSSMLPLLFLGLDTQQAEETFGAVYAEDLDSLDKQAKGLAVTLDLGSSGSRPGITLADQSMTENEDIAYSEEFIHQLAVAIPPVLSRSSSRDDTDRTASHTPGA
ncbi:uncharacterized protein HRG_08389 [Hirsutella rhossiliensis]|uniref:Uncharacterized protein n=1 Tax=Hirsutella rhossiliensis TaxID=111463 RepID=A0A9P8MSA5_9HYPO|nr:uncharacterized protein HRG_08389 [Hirsutella rhossiliensis]KAH0960234.1 hypothetical protein HRG_08389 [Hirsutella rhossiliensis]